MVNKIIETFWKFFLCQFNSFVDFCERKARATSAQSLRSGFACALISQAIAGCTLQREVWNSGRVGDDL